MKRRSLLKAAVLTTLSGAVLPKYSKATELLKKNMEELYELRIYNLKNAQQQDLVETYFSTAAIPALNRLGCKNIGVFTELKPGDQIRLYVLIPYRSPDDFLTVQNKLADDKVYQAAGQNYLNAPATAPAYVRIESSLLKAFTHMPNMQIPPNKPRIFELRRYEHASESAGQKKLEMFNNAGEIDIFKRLDFNPVFFGETLIGAARPNLTYMITFEDMQAHDSHWKAFGRDPEWKKISSIPEYADAKLVSHITSTFLMPTGFSQI